MSALQTNELEVLKTIVEDKGVKPQRTIADALYTLVSMGFVADEFRATDRGAMYAVVHCGASFLKFLDKYPNLRPKWYATLENVEESLGKDAVDPWFAVISETYLQLNYFNQYNYALGGPDLSDGGKLMTLNLTLLYNGLQKQKFDEKKLIKMFMPPYLRVQLGTTASVAEVKALLLSQLPGIAKITGKVEKGT